MKRKILFVIAALAVMSGCERIPSVKKVLADQVNIPVEDVAALLSEIRMGGEQLHEVYDAVTSSAWNGYDEEYMMCDLFSVPGAGVGDDRLPAGPMEAKRRAMGRKVETKVGVEYSCPLRELIVQRLEHRVATKAGNFSRLTPDEYMKCLEKSDIQIYWPFSENWDGKEYPVITFDPDDGSVANVGYKLVKDEDGTAGLEEIIVDENYAAAHPVWVVNRNNDCAYTSLELMRMADPEWGSGGGEIIVGKKPAKALTKAEDEVRHRTLILRDFTMNRNFDPWLAGASEFFVKIGAIDEFTARTEAELQQYSPVVTDFVISVRRSQVGKPQPFNAILLSDWTDQLISCAFMIMEDDGGTTTKWDCSGVVKINSKSYGFEVSIPLRTRDDIVWRGQLSKTYIEASNGKVAHYGDVDLVFEIIEN